MAGEAILMLGSMLLLMAMSESMTMQWQGLMLMSMAHFTTRDLVWMATQDHVDVQDLYRTGPTPHWMQPSGDLAPPLTCSNTWERGP